ncbi:MAG: LamG-like jellyroll fold domain-containing protein [Polyangiaceae bacterium]
MPTRVDVAQDAAPFVAVSGDVHADARTTPDERAQLARDYADAVQRVAASLGPQRAVPPIAVYCKTDACRDLFGPSRRSRGIHPGERVPWGTLRAGERTAVFIDAVGPGSAAVLVHEMVHAEVGARLAPQRVPSWFDEGVAVLLAGAPPCAGASLPPGIDDLRRLDDRAVLGEYTDHPALLVPTYCQARGEVAAWVERHGQAQLLALIDVVHVGAPFEDAYGPLLTQPPGPMTTLLTSPATHLGDPARAFTLALWIEPAADAGVLAHVSSDAVGSGWCTPFLGFDAGHRLVAQLLHGGTPDASSYAVAVDPAAVPVGRWTHVAMTWGPGSPVRLYVDGALVAEAASPGYRASGAGRPMTVAWGSSNAGGAGCFRGAVEGGAFAGAVTGMAVLGVELGADGVRALAARRP